MILLFVADTVGFLIERVVLRLGDRNLLGSAANVDEIGLLIVVVLHNESPPSAFAEMESSRHAKPDHRREGITEGLLHFGCTSLPVIGTVFDCHR